MASTQRQNHTQVLIIGSGIVGLSASLFLAHQGITSILIERHSSTSIHPRGRSVNARTMELYRSISIASSVREAGKSLGPSMGIYSGTTVKDIVEGKQRKEGRKWPLGDLFEKLGPERGQWGTQDVVEPVLLQAARERGVDARFFTECVGVEQDGERVVARLRDRGSGEVYTVSADYCIAADGANSPIRSQLGIQRRGPGVLGNLLNILFEADLGEFVKGREFSICKIENGPVLGFWAAINNSEKWTFHLFFDQEKGEKPEDFMNEKIEEYLHLALGMPDVKIDIKSVLPWQPSVSVVGEDAGGTDLPRW